MAAAARRQARSGWGISPTTLPAALQTPAMSSIDAVRVVGVAQHDAVLGPELGKGARSQVKLPSKWLIGRARSSAPARRAEVSAVRVAATCTRRWCRGSCRPLFFCSAPGQQAGLGEDLEAVADAERPARRRRRSRRPPP